MRLIIVMLTILFLGPTLALAQGAQTEEQAAPAQPLPKPAEYAYSPKYCEFSITFPEEPYKTQNCDDEGKRCYEQVSFTKVYALSSTVNFRILCNPIDKDLFDQYTPDVMESTLRAMSKSRIVNTYNTDVREEPGYKQAGLVGAGRIGQTPTIYLAQLWVGKQSVFSVEAELVGEPDEAADLLFSVILKSVKYTGIKDGEKITSPALNKALPLND